MKIGIHNEPYSGALGGSEVSVAVLAHALAKNHEVEILHYRPTTTVESLAQYADVDLHNVRSRVIPRQPARRERARHLWDRYRAEKLEDAGLSKPYDLFITFNHRAPPFCAAPIGVLMVLFPFFDPHQMRSECEAHSILSSAFQEWLRLAWNKWKLKSRLNGYQVKVAISEFTRRWTRRRWHTDCQVIFPPVDVHIPPVEKSNSILSVGRFAIEGHGKKQIEMIKAFERLKASGWPDWHYHCVGACGPSIEELAFFEKAHELSASSGANVLANLDRTRLKCLYQKARIFWHATGLDADEDLNPELTEHFGITTVEAMAAGCVPVVINKGGQSESVEHGVSGFLWNTPEEWQYYTARLMQDSVLCEKMSSAARDRADLFSREKYIARFCSLLAPHLTGSHPSTAR
jgi:glycosyltransferase involved in cell wall biosynthesis